MRKKRPSLLDAIGEKSPINRKSDTVSQPVAALSRSLKDVSERGIREIDPNSVEDSKIKDRLPDPKGGGISDLAKNIKKYGQLSPILVRPIEGNNLRFEIVYGRRRLAACRQAGITVKAIVRNMSDLEAVVAQGQENSARENLSYHEQLRYAAQIIEQGYDRDTVEQALNVDKTAVSRMLKVANSVPETVSDAIGIAPNTGRRPWIELAERFSVGQMTEEMALEILEKEETIDSDQRLNTILSWNPDRPAKDVDTPEKPASEQSGEMAKPDKKEIQTDPKTPTIGVRNTKTKLTLSVEKSPSMMGFADWLAENAESLIEQLQDQYKTKNDLKQKAGNKKEEIGQ